MKMCSTIRLTLALSGYAKDSSVQYFIVQTRAGGAPSARKDLNVYLGGLISSGYMANLDNKGLGLKFVKSGRCVAYIREDLVAWLELWLSVEVAQVPLTADRSPSLTACSLSEFLSLKLPERQFCWSLFSQNKGLQLFTHLVALERLMRY